MKDFAKKYAAMKNFEKLVFHAGEHVENYVLQPERVAQGYYVETGRYKPWSTLTVKAAKARGLITIVRVLWDLKIYYVLPTEKGLELYKELIAK